MIVKTFPVPDKMSRFETSIFAPFCQANFVSLHIYT